jgi:hypothetical protein
MKPATTQSHRLPNGGNYTRIQVLLPESVTKRFLLDARANMRSASAQAALIISRHYEQQQEGA